jgi:uncharacterized protein YneF (UPF0154 family)
MVIVIIIASLIVGFDLGVYCTYKVFQDEAKKEEDK